ncbi:hypothetical protein E2C01_071288 [Portunus trituberculatus]|uniref:Uncharacterized protein n=1 Tax=Portunus trituberculatus TaxID=210409 RepID=A0A5B7I7U1_PORTR|nr:hypothetical protein [Portunus trituberculatus]
MNMATWQGTEGVNTTPALLPHHSLPPSLILTPNSHYHHHFNTLHTPPLHTSPSLDHLPLHPPQPPPTPSPRPTQPAVTTRTPLQKVSPLLRSHGSPFLQLPSLLLVEGEVRDRKGIRSQGEAGRFITEGVA